MVPAVESTSAVKIRPLADRIVVRPIKKTEHVRGGLHIPDTVKNRPLHGKVVAAGPGPRRVAIPLPFLLRRRREPQEFVPRQPALCRTRQHAQDVLPMPPAATTDRAAS